MIPPRYVPGLRPGTLAAALLALVLGAGLVARELRTARAELQGLERQLAAQTAELRRLAPIVAAAVQAAEAARADAHLAIDVAAQVRTRTQPIRDSLRILDTTRVTVAGDTLELPPLVVRVIEAADRRHAADSVALVKAARALAADSVAIAELTRHRDQALAAAATAAAGWTAERKRGRWAQLRAGGIGAGVGVVIGLLAR